MQNFIPFIVKINRAANTLEVLKSAGDKAFGNPEAAIQYLGGLPDNCQCISSGDYRQFKKQGYTITRSDLKKTTISVRNITVISGKVFTWFQFMNMESGYKLCHDESFVLPCLTDEECEVETKLSIKNMESLIQELV
jgi:hypothetical protein